jgi:hypothetical protein
MLSAFHVPASELDSCNHMAPVGSRPLSVRDVAVASIALLACVLTVFVFHLPTLPADSISKFDPTKCKPGAALLDCWDGFSKEHNKCISLAADSYLRAGHRMPADGQLCYKSIYFNMDFVSVVLCFWVFLWFAITSRTVEALVTASLDGQLRRSVAAASLFAFPMVWYCCWMPFHYLNDRWCVGIDRISHCVSILATQSIESFVVVLLCRYPMMYSQMFFSVTDIYSTVVTLMHIRQDAPRHTRLLIGVAGVALAHLAELFIDEPFFLNSSLLATARNFGFVLGDVLNFAYAWRLLGCESRKLGRICTAALPLFLTIRVIIMFF